MIRIVFAGVGLIALAGCGGSSSGGGGTSADPADTSSAAGAAVAVVVDRYGDCLKKIGDSLDGQVLPSSTEEHTQVGFGPKPVIFSVTEVNGKTYVVPVDAKSTRTLGKGGDTC